MKKHQPLLYHVRTCDTKRPPPPPPPPHPKSTICSYVHENILFVKDCLSENATGSFNYKFQPSKLPLNHTTRSLSTYQLKG